MIVISNHVKTIGMEIPKDAVVRINVAWVESKETLHRILNENANNSVWLDYPTGRNKPPKPVLTLSETINFCKVYGNLIKYFAFSNAEDTNIIELIRQAVPEHITLVPKIETYKGVAFLPHIVEAAKTKIVMLDKEDLYVDLKMDSNHFNSACNEVLKTCNNLGITCLTLKGVIFSEAN